MRRHSQDGTAQPGWIGALVGVLVGVACAHAGSATTSAPAPTPAPPLASFEPAAPPAPPSIVPTDVRNPSAEQVADILSHAGFQYSTVAPGKRWRVTFAGHKQPTVSVDVVYSDHFTVVLGQLFTMPPTADNDVYKAIAERNFDLEQMKLSVDPSGAVFASFEVPTRILDRRELLENIVSLAAALDSLKLDEASQAEPVPTPRVTKPPEATVRKIRADLPPPLPDWTL